VAVHRSSESVASLAAALAKAQAEPVNPEKTLAATIRPEMPGATASNQRAGTGGGDGSRSRAVIIGLPVLLFKFMIKLVEIRGASPLGAATEVSSC
jgi:hypothetical protein